MLYDKEYEWLFWKEPCAICSSIFNAILSITNNPDDIFNMVKAKRFFFNRKLGEGISVYNPSDEISGTKIKRDENIQKELDKIKLGKFIFNSSEVFQRTKLIEKQRKIFDIAEIKISSKYPKIEINT